MRCVLSATAQRRHRLGEHLVGQGLISGARSADFGFVHRDELKGVPQGLSMLFLRMQRSPGKKNLSLCTPGKKEWWGKENMHLREEGAG